MGQIEEQRCQQRARAAPRRAGLEEYDYIVVFDRQQRCRHAGRGTFGEPPSTNVCPNKGRVFASHGGCASVRSDNAALLAGRRATGEIRLRTFTGRIVAVALALISFGAVDSRAQEPAPPASTVPNQPAPTPPAQTQSCTSPIGTVEVASVEHRPSWRQQPLHHGEEVSTPGTVVVPAHGWLRLATGDDQLRLTAGRLRLACDAPPELLNGSLGVAGGKGTIVWRQGTFVATTSGTRATIIATHALTRVWLYAGAGRVSRSATAEAAGSIDLLPGDKALIRAATTPQLDTWPFAPSPSQRRSVPSDHLPAFWDNAGPCSTGCRPRGAIPGWPIKPFHRQHGLRAGLNERRRANMHIGVDIQARDGAPVYAIQGGTASVAAVGTVDERVQVGNYSYWHIHHLVASGQRVIPYRTVIGTVLKTAGHVHLSETSGGRYLNPLRPGGRVLAPWTDTSAPIIKRPAVHKDARGYHVVVEAFDPQSYRELVTYRTPVLALAALAYRAFDEAGHDVTGLQWALRGAQHYPDIDRFIIYAHGAHTRAWSCFAARLSCPPLWKYRLTDGLTPPIPPSAHTLAIYAYDWAGNISVREVPLT
jgi:murein DD-endopeptidase MepM/ murein hydrolase activator NlpD